MRRHPPVQVGPWLLAGLLLAGGGALLAGGCGATINVVDCDDGEVRCGDTCVDLDTNPKHCGECFARCVDGCTDGVCDGGGQGGGGTGGDTGQGGDAGCGLLTDCGGTCVDTSSDEDHCGGCAQACGPGLACQGGLCVPDACAPLTDCAGICTSIDSDPFNCGDCGRVCDTGLCALGDCVDSCPGGLSQCAGSCVDLSSDEQNCGGCFIPCAPSQICEGFACRGGGCDLACGLCQVVELPSTTSLSIAGSTAGGGDGLTSGCAGSSGAPEIGHRFVAPITGRYAVDTFGSSFDTVLSVLGGCGEIVCNDDAGTTESQVFVDLIAGQEVYFVVDGYAEGMSGQYTLNVFTPDVPTCDPGLVQCGELCVDVFSDRLNCGGCFIPCGEEEACVGGICQCSGPGCNECDTPTCGSCSSVTFLPATVPITTAGSTVGEDDGIQPGCGTPEAPESLFLFEAPFTASYRFDTFGSSYDTVLSVRGAGCGELACNDDFEDLASFVEVPLSAGQEVVVAVDGFGDAGTFQLHVDADIPLCGPVLEGPLPIVVSDTTIGQGDAFATSCIGSGAPERRYHFVAPASRVYSFDMSGSSYDTVLEILDGTCGSPSIACNDDFETVASHVEAFLEADQLVTIIVDGFGSDAGAFVLTIDAGR